MVNQLQTFLQNAEEMKLRNERVEQERKQKALEEKEKRQKELQSLIENPSDYDETLHPVKRIQELGFEIVAHRERPHPYGQERYGMIHEFYCAYKEWLFSIGWMADPDIPEGVLALRNPRHKKTDEVVPFYCDLFGNVTKEAKLKRLMTLLNEGYASYREKYFEAYLALPHLLGEQGLSATPVSFHFEGDTPYGHIELGDDVHIRFYSHFNDEIRMVVTNNPRWKSYWRNIKEHIAYPFDYKGPEDIEALCLCIQACKEHVQGRFGYEEEVDGNKVYYSGEDFLGVFDRIKSEIKERDYEKWNRRFIEMNIPSRSNFDIGTIESVNLYLGIEIDEKVLITLNDDNQWMVGEETIHYLVHFTYDKRKDAENCHLIIRQWIMKPKEAEGCEFLQNEKMTNHPSYRGAFQTKGAFSAMKDLADSFVRQNLDVFQFKI